MKLNTKAYIGGLSDLDENGEVFIDIVDRHELGTYLSVRWSIKNKDNNNKPDKYMEFPIPYRGT